MEKETSNNSLQIIMYAYFDKGTNGPLYAVSFRYVIKDQGGPLDEILADNVRSDYNGKYIKHFSFEEHAYTLVYDEFIFSDFSDTISYISFKISEEMFQEENYHKSTTGFVQFYDNALNSLGIFSLSCDMNTYAIPPSLE